MPNQRMTARTIPSLPVPETGQVDYWDTDFPGFGVRVTSKGARAFVFMYRNADGQKRRYTLGRFPTLSLADARDSARAIGRKVADGLDPAAEKSERRKAATVSEMADSYLGDYAMHAKRSWKKDRQAIERDIKPFIGSRKAMTITQEDIEALIDKVVNRGSPIQANRTFEILRGMFNWSLSKASVRREYGVTVNPCIGVQKPSKEKSRDRVLSIPELCAVWHAAEADQTRNGAVAQLLILTAQRIGEVCKMQPADIEADWWTIPAENSKNGFAHRVPLTPTAGKIVSEAIASTPEPGWLFPKYGGGGHLVNVQKLADRIRARSGVKDFRFHDIRRSVVSHLRAAGIDRGTGKKILNHLEADVTAVYDRYGLDREKREALTLWESLFLEALND